MEMAAVPFFFWNGGVLCWVLGVACQLCLVAERLLAVVVSLLAEHGLQVCRLQ